MPGRKMPQTREEDDEHEYLKWNLREGGVNLQGDQGAELAERGGAVRVRRQREDREPI
jgi:hypothetical protein